MRQKLMPAAAIILMLSHFGAAKRSKAPGPLPQSFGVSIEIGRHHWHDPYVGEWSNGRGAALIITASMIKFASDKPVPYHDVTRVTNGREFHLEITVDTKLNYLTRFLHASFGEGDKIDQMKLSLYNSRKDMEAAENSQGEATWYRSK